MFNQCIPGRKGIVKIEVPRVGGGGEVDFSSKASRGLNEMCFFPSFQFTLYWRLTRTMKELHLKLRHLFACR